MGRPAFPHLARRGNRARRPAAPSGGVVLRPHILLLSGLVLGGAGGTCVKLFAPNHLMTLELLRWFVRPVEQLFLGVLFLLIVPLLFSSIVTGLSLLRGKTGVPGLRSEERRVGNGCVRTV